MGSDGEGSHSTVTHTSCRASPPNPQARYSRSGGSVFAFTSITISTGLSR